MLHLVQLRCQREDPKGQRWLISKSDDRFTESCKIWITHRLQKERLNSSLFLPAAKRHGLVEVFVVVLLGKTFFWVNFVVVLLGKTIFCFYDNFSCFLLERLFLYIVCILKDANCKPGLKYILKCLV